MHLELEHCKLAMFLPTSIGDGVCSTDLVKFLIERHNDFIQGYHDLKHSEIKYV